MNVDHTDLLNALKNEKGDIPDAEKMKVADELHDYVTRRMGTDKDR